MTTSTQTTADPRARSKRDDNAWREFPIFERTLGSAERAPVLDAIASTCRELNAFVQSGSDAERARAQKALTAFGRTLDLLKSLEALRDSNPAAAPLDNR